MRDQGRSAPVDEFRGTERFQLLGRLGEGGMGVVYHAHDRLRGADVALKTLLRMDAAGISRLKREFRIIADIAHPNLVTLYELIAAEERWFFTMELVRGAPFTDHVRDGALAQALRAGTPSGPGAPLLASTIPASEGEGRADGGGARQGAPDMEASPASALAPSSRGGELQPVDMARLRPALEQLVQAVEALHDAGKLHLDLKPFNVLVDPNGRVVVLDFGIAHDTTAAIVRPATGELVVGTPVYMAPEQIRGVLSAAADWYAVGAILYEALTGRPPFRGDPHHVLRTKGSVDPLPPAAVRADVPPELSALCMALLQREPRARATGEDVLRVLAGLQRAPETRTSPLEAHRARSPASAPITASLFVGREAELRELEDAFEATRRGRSVAVYIHGRSGMGKSALARRFASDLRSRRGALVLAGRCYERESVPFKAFDSVMDALSRFLMSLPRDEARSLLPPGIHDVARLFPALNMVDALLDVPPRAFAIEDPHALRGGAFRALKELFSSLAARAPLVLYIDDLHWGDRDSALLLAELLGPPDPPALLVLGTYRSEDDTSSPFLIELFGSSASTWTGSAEHRELALGPLPGDEAQRLARSLLDAHGEVAPELALTIAREAEGCPFFVGELVLHAHASQSGEPEGPQPDRPAALASLDGLLLARFAELPRDARRLLEVIAVAGQPVEQGAALRAAELEGDGWSALATLRSGRLVRTGGAGETDAVEAYHDRVREAVAGQIEPARLPSCHRRIAEELEGTGRADPERLAAHFRAAGDLGKTGRYAERAAARALAALAFDSAARLYRLALDCEPSGGERRHELLMRLGSALSNAGRGAEAASVYLDAARSAPAAGARGADLVTLDCKRLAAEQLLGSGHTDEGVVVLREVLASVDLGYPETSRQAVAELLLRRAGLTLRGLRFRERDERALAPQILRRIDACFSGMRGLLWVDPLRAAVFHARYLLLALAAGEPRRLARALAFEVFFAAGRGEQNRPAGDRAHDAAMKLLARSPDAIAEGVLRLGRAAFTQVRSWRQALAHVDEAERIFRERSPGAAWELCMAQLCCLVGLTMLGELEQLSRRLPGWIKEAEERGNRYTLFSLRTLVRGSTLLALSADDPVRARRELADAQALWSRRGFHRQHFSALACASLIDAYVGHGGASWRQVEAAWPSIERAGLLRDQPVRIQALDLRGRSALAACADGGDPGSLLRIAERAAEGLAGERLPWPTALARLLLAGVASVRRDPARSRAHLEAAIAGFDGLEMALHAAAARRRLGELAGGAEGRRLVLEADEALARRTVRRPDRLAAALAPGFQRPR